MHEDGVKVRFMQSDIEILERIKLTRINILREGPDIFECGLVEILDADELGLPIDVQVAQPKGCSTEAPPGTRKGRFGNPTLETLTAVLGALGLELAVQRRAA